MYIAGNYCPISDISFGVGRAVVSAGYVTMYRLRVTGGYVIAITARSMR